MKVLITGAAGFIGMHTAVRLNSAGHTLLGVDNFNDYYDPALKRARQNNIEAFCPIETVDISDVDKIKATILEFEPQVIVHLAAQAGVRYSLENPMAYIQSNVTGHTAILEACRELGDKLSHLVYASSSSVYGGNTKIPFSETDEVNQPVSLYAATKRADELISSTYAHLFGIKQIGLRFFTVYGPWGRPDMAYWSFTRNILNDKTIRIFNHGDMRRDFTYVDDIVSCIGAITEKAPEFAAEERPHRVYNIGNNNPEQLMDVIEILETALGKEAIKEFVGMQPGDVRETYANIDAINRDYGYEPTTSISDGLPRFISWYRQYTNSPDE